MDPTLDPRQKTLFSTPKAYEQLYQRGLPASDYLARNRYAILPREAVADELQAIYRAIGGSPERTPTSPPKFPPERMFRALPEGPRAGSVPRNFPIELLEQKPGMFGRMPPMAGVGLSLLPTLLQLRGDTNPDIATWRAERAMVTPPELSRSVPDRVLAMPPPEMMNQYEAISRPLPSHWMNQVEPLKKAAPSRDRIQELFDMISARKGRD